MRMPTCLAALPLVWALAACGGGAEPPATYARRCALPEQAAEPDRVTAPGGTQCLGAAEFLVTDAARAEPFTPAPDDRRTLQVRVVYPAAADARAPRMPYADAAQLEGWPAGMRPQGHARRDVPVTTPAPAPVIVFSPGLTANAEWYAGLTEDLASRGYIVVTVNHPYISGATRQPGGAIARPARELEGAAELLEVTVADLGTVLDWLARQNASAGSPLAGKLDLARVGAFGHSFGGATALHLLRADPRVKAAANLDGTVYGDLRQPWTKPWMILQAKHVIGGISYEDDTVQQMWDNRRGPAVRELLPDACHGDFGDAHGLVDAYVGRHPGTPNPIDAAEEGLYCAADPAALERDVRARLAEFFARFVR